MGVLGRVITKSLALRAVKRFGAWSFLGCPILGFRILRFGH